MNSRLYECQVVHARFIPKPHRFSYRLFLLAVDLDELPALHRRLRLFSVNRPNLYSFRESDYLPITEPQYNPSAEPVSPLPQTGKNQHGGRPGAAPEGAADPEMGSAAVTKPAIASKLRNSEKPGPLKARVLAFFAAHGVDPGPDSRIELLTLPRIFGYAFNPVSFYFAYDAAGSCVAAIAEVTNTFREMKPYCFGPADRRTDSTPSVPCTFHRRVPKFFYVSPFSDVDVEFDFQLRAPTEKLFLQIDDYVGNQRTFTSHLSGPARPLTDARLAGLTFRFPLLTLRIIALIHWQALRLFFKKMPWFAKAARPADQRDLYHPHRSLSSANHANPSAPPDA